MRAIIDRLIRSYGNDVQIKKGDSTIRSRMFFQFVTSKSWQNMERMITTGGEVPRGQYLFIARGNVPIAAADAIMMDDRCFIVRRADNVLFRNEKLFIWGLCVEGGIEDPWTT